MIKKEAQRRVWIRNTSKLYIWNPSKVRIVARFWEIASDTEKIPLDYVGYDRLGKVILD